MACTECLQIKANLLGALQAAEDAKRSRDALEFVLQLLMNKRKPPQRAA